MQCSLYHVGFPAKHWTVTLTGGIFLIASWISSWNVARPALLLLANVYFQKALTKIYLFGLNGWQLVGQSYNVMLYNYL